MIYGSVCSGIEGASVAWEPLGWRPAWFAEIDPFACAVLRHRWPEVPNLGDFTRIGKEVPCAAIDLLVGGTPCQAFSVAGLRAGLADPRGNLTLEFLALADRVRPGWIFWENVPGVLSSLSNDAPDPAEPPPPVDVELDEQELETEDEHHCEELHAFNCFLAGLSELGYGWAYWVPDAQYFGLAQRRARVFVVGHLGTWQPAAAVLPDRLSMRWDPPPSRTTGEGAARPLGSCPPGGSGYRNDADTADNLEARPLTASAGGYRSDSETETLLAQTLLDASEDGTGRGTPLVVADVAETLRDHPRPGSNSLGAITFDYKASAATDKTFRGKSRQSIVDPPGRTRALISSRGLAVAFHGSQDPDVSGDVAHPIGTNGGREACVAIPSNEPDSAWTRCQPEPGDPCHPLASSARPPALATPMAVRRLTPRECERLQGFPDDYTLVPVRGGVAADGPRYRALGNSFPVPVVRWIGERIAAVDAALREEATA